MSCLRKYLIKALFFLSIIAFLITAAATLLLNSILARSINTMLEAAGKYFPQKISIGSVFYLPPHTIVIKNATMVEADGAKKELISVAAARIKLSLAELILRRRASISSVTLYRPKIDYSGFCGFVGENFERAADFIKHMPKRDIKLSIKEAELGMVQDDGAARYAAANLFLKIRGGVVTARCSMGGDSRNPLLNQPLGCKFKGVMTDGGFSVENLEFKGEGFYAKFWGDSSGRVLWLSGFAFMNTMPNSRDYGEGEDFNASDKMKSARLRRAGGLAAAGLANANLYFLDIGCQVNLMFPLARIERMSFTLNNIPVSLKGSILFSQPLGLDLALSSGGPREEAKALSQGLQKADLKFKGTLDSNMFKGNSMLSLDFARMKPKKSGPALERLKLGFKDLALHFNGQERVKMSLEQLSLFCLAGGSAYRAFLNNLNAIIYPRSEKSKFIEFNSLFYDGSIRGWGRVDLDTTPARISCAAWIRNVDANGLGSLLAYFSKVSGRLYGQGYFNSYPRLGLTGSMVVNNGYLRDFEFFKWLADTFNLPSLKEVNFVKLSSNFTVNPEGAGLREIKLNAQDVNLSGYFNLGADNLVSSKLSLSLSRELLKGSAKFAPLLKLSDSGLDFLSFNFQLSGVLDAMNFQWLDSDLKKDVQGAIPGFIERKIERGVENIIDSAK